MIILSDGEREYSWYLDRETLERCRKEEFRVVLYQNKTEYVLKLDGLFIVKET